MYKHYKLGIIDERNNRIKLYNNDAKRGVRPLFESLLKDVDVEILDNGIFKINANRFIFDFYFDEGRRIFENKWHHTPIPSVIHQGRRFPWCKKERFVYQGWVQTVETERVEYVLPHYTIEIYG